MHIKVKAMRLVKTGNHYCQVENDEMQTLILNMAKINTVSAETIEDEELTLPVVSLDNGEHWELHIDWYEFEKCFCDLNKSLYI